MLSRLLNGIFATTFLVAFQMTSSVINEKMFKMTRTNKVCPLDPVHWVLDPFLYHMHAISVTAGWKQVNIFHLNTEFLSPNYPLDDIKKLWTGFWKVTLLSNVPDKNCALEEKNWLQILSKHPLLFKTYPIIHVNISLKCVYPRVDKIHPNIVESSGLCQVMFLQQV